MKPLMRQLHLVLTIGGGFTGIVLTVAAVFNTKESNPLFYAMMLAFIGLYSFGVYAGLQFADDRESKDLDLLIAYYWLQVPWLSSPVLSYRFASGFQVSGGWSGNQPFGGFRLGSEWQFSLAKAAPWGIGLNVFALVMVVLLMRRQAVPPPMPAGASVPETTQPASESASRLELAPTVESQATGGVFPVAVTAPAVMPLAPEVRPVTEENRTPSP